MLIQVTDLDKRAAAAAAAFGRAISAVVKGPLIMVQWEHMTPSTQRAWVAAVLAADAAAISNNEGATSHDKG